MASTLGDIRDADAVRRALQASQPDVVLHLAAQPLVRLSYAEPVATYATNVMGTVHLLEAVRHVDSVRAVVNVTSDKCYENREWAWGYREGEAMGGFDPYSSSKGCAELVAGAYRRSFLRHHGVAMASGRAGNVIGGGDWAADRLVPDILQACEQGRPVVIRNPQAVRPWQHVLEPLSGYLALAEHLFEGRPDPLEACNFGPLDADAVPVQQLVEMLVAKWGRGARWQLDGATHPHEAHHLKLDISLARQRLGWTPRWRLAQALARTVEWQQAHLAGQDMQAMCLQQINDYSLALEATPA
jgi:CDP-glucose 4,6-dehydratase